MELKIVQPPLDHAVPPMIREIGEQRLQAGDGRMDIAVNSAGRECGHSGIIMPGAALRKARRSRLKWEL